MLFNILENDFSLVRNRLINNLLIRNIIAYFLTKVKSIAKNILLDM